MNRFDVIVIGAGSAGYAAARTLGGRGLNVGLIDKGPLGGLCILKGCMPSKTLLRSSEVLQLIREADELGLRVGSVEPDFPAIMARRARLVKGFQDYRVDGIHHAPNVTLIMGKATFVDPHAVEVEGVRYEADKFIVTTGSTPTIPDVPGLREAGFITSDEALELPEAPKSMVVLGGGVIALELGQFYARLGTRVTMLIRSGHILSQEDDDVREALEGYLREEGMEILPYSTPSRVEVKNGKKVVYAKIGESETPIEVDEIFVALGRRPNLGGLGLPAAGVETVNGLIPVDAGMRTSNPNVFAAGDCVGNYNLVHVAIYQGEIAAHNILADVRGGASREADYRIVPYAIFTDPNFARVGLSEREAAAQGIPVITGKYEFAELGKAECMGKGAMKGFVKLLASPDTGEILGAQILGPEGADLIHELIVAMEFRCTAERLMVIPHLHPTLAEIITYPAEEIAEKRLELVAR
ncbi:Dihydrolipoyl dehydrogenase [compost metagenome]